MKTHLHVVVSPRPILVIGDVMLDRYLVGAASRISPEAPVPVIRVANDRRILGGAANVATNLAALDATVTLVSAVGDDSGGQLVKRLLAEAKLDDQGIVVSSSRVTTEKTRIVANSQQIARVDVETIAEIDADCERTVLERLERLVPECSAVVISDYGKGVITSAIASRALACASAAGIPSLVDSKSPEYSRYAGADFITPNRHELSAVTGLRIDTVADAERAASLIRAQFDFGNVIATLGADGLILVNEQTTRHFPTNAREVFDVSGAGDTVIAGVALCSAAETSAEFACEFANAAAGVVVGKFGTATVTRAEVAIALGHASRANFKVLEQSVLVERLTRDKTAGRRIVFTNGCFDVLHAGHLATLEAAASFGDVLVVGLNSDASTRRLKGPDRPVNSEFDRAMVLGGLEVVDYVCIFETDTPEQLIECVRPDVLVKGGDYVAEDIVGADFVRRYGGRVEVVPLMPDRSTSRVLAKIRTGGT
jgi:D-beta-D-heptose 7-phosphate kinase/D-beta-D-heptose 1-phosphate adenosyltransferase